MTSLKLPEAVERDVRLLLSEGEKIKAIVLARRALNLGLREGKELVEGLSSWMGAEDAAQSIETEIRADEQARVREAVAQAIEAMINEADLSAGQSAANEALRMAARIARGK